MRSIRDNLVKMAHDEGKETALRAAQGIQESLETILECGDAHERVLAGDLLGCINRAITAIIAVQHGDKHPDELRAAHEGGMADAKTG